MPVAAIHHMIYRTAIFIPQFPGHDIDLTPLTISGQGRTAPFRPLYAAVLVLVY
jgi:hypothetical protein